MYKDTSNIEQTLPANHLFKTVCSCCYANEINRNKLPCSFTVLVITMLSPYMKNMISKIVTPWVLRQFVQHTFLLLMQY